jgi:hypothetical protein
MKTGNPKKLGVGEKRQGKAVSPKSRMWISSLVCARKGQKVRPVRFRSYVEPTKHLACNYGCNMDIW